MPHVQQVLERGMEGGVLLECHDRNILAYRLCKYVAVFVVIVVVSADDVDFYMHSCHASSAFRVCQTWLGVERAGYGKSSVWKELSVKRAQCGRSSV